MKNKIINRIKDFLKEREENKKWTLFFYLSGQCVGKIKIDKDFAPMGKLYILKVRGMRHILGTNKKVQIVVQSFKYKMSDEVKKECHIEVRIFDGEVI